MTEDEWLSCEDFSKLFEHLKSETIAHRKYRLFLTACCRIFLPDLLTNERTYRLIDMAERYADGSLGREELDRAKRVALAAVRDDYPLLDAAIRGISHGLPHRQAVDFPFFCLNSWDTSNFNPPTASQQRRLCDMIRDIFPFHPITPDPSWLTSTVVSLSQQMYDSRDFSTMPIMADALQDAGCDNPTILEHCRQPGSHVKGCYVVDLCLEKQ